MDFQYSLRNKNRFLFTFCKKWFIQILRNRILFFIKKRFCFVPPKCGFRIFHFEL